MLLPQFDSHAQAAETQPVQGVLALAAWWRSGCVRTEPRHRQLSEGFPQDSPAEEVLAGDPDKGEPSCEVPFVPSGSSCPGRVLTGPPALSGLISRRDSRVMLHSRNLQGYGGKRGSRSGEGGAAKGGTEKMGRCWCCCFCCWWQLGLITCKHARECNSSVGTASWAAGWQHCCISKPSVSWQHYLLWYHTGV